MSRAEVIGRYPEMVSAHYRKLIAESPAAAHLGRAVFASELELVGGDLDPCAEKSYEVFPGVQHKYQDTALMTITSRCASYCRYCFRKRLWLRGAEHVFDAVAAIEYVSEHQEIVDVVLSGGDPLMVTRTLLHGLIRKLSRVPHVRTIRIGTRAPIYNPRLITSRLLDTLRLARHRVGVYMPVHYSHPAELSPSLDSIRRLQRAGVAVLAQIPVLQGVNDSPGILSELLQGLTAAGIAPYYLFQCRPTAGNAHFSLTLGELWSVFSRETSRLSGIGRRARLVVSHATGKMELVGADGDDVLLRRHRQPRGCSEQGLMRAPKSAKWP